jgi:hypothetical protein
MNGSGKSTVGLRGLMAAINGIAESGTNGKLMGERFRFIGKYGKSADVEYTFKDEVNNSKFTIKNHITDATNKITIKSESDTPIGEDFLKSFLNVSLMSARAFCALSGREQAKALGIDTSNFDDELKKRKEEATELNARLRACGVIEPVETCAAVSIEDLEARRLAVKDRLKEQYKDNQFKNNLARAEHDQLFKKATDELNQWKAEQKANSARINQALYALEILQGFGYDGNEISEFIEGLPQAVEVMPENIGKIPELILIDPEYPDDSELKAIEDEKTMAFEQNIKAGQYQAYLIKVNTRDGLIAEITENKEKQLDCIRARNAYMAGHDFGFAGLTTDDEGNLLLNSRPISESYFSTGELELVVAKLHAAQNPSFKCRFIDDFERIDQDNQEKILKELLEAGFQVIVAEVGKSSDKDNVIVLSECAIANNQEERPKLI